MEHCMNIRGNSLKTCIRLLVFWPEYLLRRICQRRKLFHCMTSIEPLQEWCMSTFRACRQVEIVSQIRPFPYNTLNFNYPLFNIIYVLLNFHTSNGYGGAKKTRKIAFDSGWFHRCCFHGKTANSSVFQNAIWQFFKTFICRSTYLIHVISPLFQTSCLSAIIWPHQNRQNLDSIGACLSVEFV